MLDHFRRQAARFADFTICGVVFELQREKFEGEGIKSWEGRVTRAPIRTLKFGVRASWNSALRKNGLAQARGEF